MRFFGGLQMTKLGWLALAVAGGVVACGENDTLEPVDTSPSTDGTGSTVSSQTSMTTSTSSASTQTTGTTSTAPTTTSTNTTTTTSTSSAASSSSSATSSSTSTSATSTATSDETSSETTSDETSDATSSDETSSDETTGGGGKPPADPSAGCGKANPQTGNAQSPLTVSGYQYYVKLPQSYDPSKPYPIVMMLHPTGDVNKFPWAENNAGFEQTGAKDAAIRVYPQCSVLGNGWNPADQSFFQPLYDTVTSNFCVDKARIFVAGESSGGDMAGYLGCAHADKIRGIGPGAPKKVGQWPLNAGQANCSGQVHATIIYSPRDNVLNQNASGAQMTDYYRELNNCSDMSDPVQGYTDNLSNCVQYRGCDENYPVIRCSHEDPEYSNTYHGWPRFAAKMLWATWSEL